MIRVQFHRNRKGLDKRCDAIVLDPITGLCKKWDIPMGEGLVSAEVHIHYRFVTEPRPVGVRGLHGVLIDDHPVAYHPDYMRMYALCKGYDFYVSSNRRLLEHLCQVVGDKPCVYFKGLCAKEYYRDRGVLKPRQYHTVPRMCIIAQGGYDFGVEKFYVPGWKMLYFYRRKVHEQGNRDMLWQGYMPLEKYYEYVSKFAPDVIVQGWVDTLNFRYKANLKFRESVALESCLVAQDKEGIYGLENGVNGYIWNDMEEYRSVMTETPVEAFRGIGKAHVDTDRDLLEGLYKDLSELL